MANQVKNTLITEAEEPKAPEKQTKVKSRSAPKVSKSLGSIISGSFLSGKKVTKQLPFILCIALLAMCYIANNYNSQKTAIKINNTLKEIEGLRYEYISTKSNLMYISKQSEIVKRLGTSGLKEAIVPPEKIFIEDKDSE
ncbi:MAG: FtsL-like putative cell division protein [Bacteroidota bacterium]|nr:FtsL-like putative cell division protein [Bacteroidota bacterium]